MSPTKTNTKNRSGCLSNTNVIAVSFLLTGYQTKTINSGWEHYKTSAPVKHRGIWRSFTAAVRVSVFRYDRWLPTIFRCVFYVPADSVPSAASCKNENIIKMAQCISISCREAYYVSQGCYKGCVHGTPRPRGTSSWAPTWRFARQAVPRASFTCQIASIKRTPWNIAVPLSPCIRAIHLTKLYYTVFTIQWV
jgi:hypothetical protein